MGGQACVFYGAAEFSRDLDLLILLEDENLDRVLSALNELQASPIAVSQFAAQHRKWKNSVEAERERARPIPVVK